MHETTTETNPWQSSIDTLRAWDPQGAELLSRMGTNPWRSGVLPRKEVELISLALHCACTNLNEAGTRRHVRGAIIFTNCPRSGLMTSSDWERIFTNAESSRRGSWS